MVENGVRGGASGLREDWAVDFQHGTGVVGSSHPCTNGHHPN